MGLPWCPSNAGDMDSISGQETKLPHAKRCDPCPLQKKKKKTKTESPNIQTLDGGCMSVWDVLKPGVDGEGVDTWAYGIMDRPWEGEASQVVPVVSLENPMHRGTWWATVHRVTKIGCS